MNDWHWRLIARQFSGLATPEEEAWLEEWQATDPERAHLVRSLRRVWELSEGLPAIGDDAPRVWRRVAPRIQQASAPEPGAPVDVTPHRSRSEPRKRGQGPARRSPVRVAWHDRGRSRARSTQLLVAAAVLIAVAVPALLWQPISQLVERRSEPPETREFVTGRGERVRISLNDGTQIVLGPESRVQLPVRFARNRRELELAGIALFDVAHDPRRPFRVRAGHAVVQALGTAFVVRAYSPDRDLEVAVTEGRVALQSQALDTVPRVVLSPHQIGRMTPAGTISLSEDPRALERHLAWTEGRLVFQDTPLREVLEELERWYDVELRIESDRLSSELLTLSILGDPLHEVLEIIALSVDLRYKRDGNTVVFYPNGNAR